VVKAREMVERVLIAAQKARSNVAELDHNLEPTPKRDLLWEVVDPVLYRDDEMNIVTVCERILSPDREVQAIDVVNVLTLARRSEVLRLSYALRWHEEMPEPLFAYGMLDADMAGMLS